MFDLRPYSNRSQNMMEQFSKAFEDMFNRDFLPSGKNDFQSLRTDITESKDAYVVQADLPGFSKNDIQINLENNQFTIRAKRDDQMEERDENDRVIRQERHFGEFVRSFYVENIDQDKVEASLEDGVLKVKLPKANPDDSGLAKQIEIN